MRAKRLFPWMLALLLVVAAPGYSILLDTVEQMQ